MNSRGSPLAIVTGGGSDIGHPVSCRLAQEGYFVSVWDGRFGAALNALSEIERGGHDADAIQVDLGSMNSINRAALLTVTEWGLPALLVNCAGPAGSLEEQMNAASACIGAVSSGLKDMRNAVVVNVFARSEVSQAREQVRVQEWTESMSARLKPFGVRVNSLVVESSERDAVANATSVLCSKASTAPSGGLFGMTGALSR